MKYIKHVLFSANTQTRNTVSLRSTEQRKCQARTCCERANTQNSEPRINPAWKMSNTYSLRHSCCHPCPKKPSRCPFVCACARTHSYEPAFALVRARLYVPGFFVCLVRPCRLLPSFVHAVCTRALPLAGLRLPCA
jgi:hypothetical protein